MGVLRSSEMNGLAQAAARLRELHHGPEPLVLANAWDAASARSVVEAGFSAVATTSSGVSATLGYPDGEQTPADEMFAAVARMARVVPSVPLTADIEAGYGLSAVDLVARLFEAGAVGCNLEDSDHAQGGHALIDPRQQAQRIRSVKQAAHARGVDVVLNARVDVFLRQHGQPDAAVQVGQAFGGEGPAVRRPVLVGRADQLDRPRPLRAARPAKDSDLDHDAGHFQGETRRRRRRRPTRGRAGDARLLKGGDVDFDAELHVRLGEVPGGQKRKINHR